MLNKITNVRWATVWCWAKPPCLEADTSKGVFLLVISNSQPWRQLRSLRKCLRLNHTHTHSGFWRETQASIFVLNLQ